VTKDAILENLIIEYRSFADCISKFGDKEFLFAPAGKWNAGQQLDHLIRAVSPLAQGLRLPKFIVRIVFGKSNRPSKTYDELVKKYLLKLQEGGKASRRFVPSEILPQNRRKNVELLMKKIARLGLNINSYSEQQLDTFILPHPLLGKVTLREMMYFTIYHAKHHLEQTKRNAGK
jgi:hypothetical protein